MLTNAHNHFQPRDEAERDELEALIREDFAHCHPGETLADVKRRAPFSRDDRGLLREWMEVAATRAATAKTRAAPGRAKTD